MIKYISLVLLTLICIAPSTVQARDLTVYCEYEPPPGVSIGDTSGIIYEQVWEILQRANMVGRIRVVTWKRGMIEVTTKPDIALFPTTRTAERENKFHWIGPIFRVQWAFFKHRDSDFAINSIDDARKVQSIGTYTDDAKEAMLKRLGFTNLVSMRDNQKNFKRLYRQRIDLMVGSLTGVEMWKRRYNADPNTVIPCHVFRTVDLYLALSHGTNPATLAKLQKAFDSIVADGTVNRIYARWLPGRRPPISQ